VWLNYLLSTDNVDEEYSFHSLNSKINNVNADVNSRILKFLEEKILEIFRKVKRKEIFWMKLCYDINKRRNYITKKEDMTKLNDIFEKDIILNRYVELEKGIVKNSLCFKAGWKKLFYLLRYPILTSFSELNDNNNNQFLNKLYNRECFFHRRNRFYWLCYYTISLRYLRIPTQEIIENEILKLIVSNLRMNYWFFFYFFYFFILFFIYFYKVLLINCFDNLL
jgi:hypothetical protein